MQKQPVVEQTLLIYSGLTRIGKNTSNIRAIFAYDTGFLRVEFPDVDQIRVGDRVHIRGIVSELPPSSPNIFNIKKRLIVQHYSISNQGAFSGLYSIGSLLRFFQETRGSLASHIGVYLPSPHAELLAGILFGGNAIEDKNFLDQLAMVGLVHLVSASGFNLVMVSQAVEKLLVGRLSRGGVFFGGLLFTLGYVAMVGFSPVIGRAFLMWCFAAVARLFGREYHGLWSLFLSSILLVLFQPATLFQAGFKLSFLATFALYQVDAWMKRPVFRRYSSMVRLCFTEFLSGVLIFFLTAPVLLWHFGKLSLIGLFSTPLIAWTIPPLMVFGFCLVVGNFLWSGFGTFMALFAYPPLEIFIQITRVLSQFSSGVLVFSENSQRLYALILFVLVMVILLTVNTAKKHGFSAKNTHFIEN